MPRGIPVTWAGWQSALVGSCRMFEGVRSVNLDLLAGNAAVITVPTGLPDGTAAVLHSSQDQFVVGAEVLPSGELDVRSPSWKSSWGFGVTQKARINTLVLVPPSLSAVSMSLVAGELWYIGPGMLELSDQPPPATDAADTADAADPPPTTAPPGIATLSAVLIAGDVNIVDAAAAQVFGRSWLGDVNMRWDLPASPAPRRTVQVEATTWLGDVRCVASFAPEVALKRRWGQTLRWLQSDTDVMMVDRPPGGVPTTGAFGGKKIDRKGSPWRFSGMAARHKWLVTTGREFFK